MNTETNIRKWNNLYKQLSDSPSEFKYGKTESYSEAAKFLYYCLTVEDWGCGAGGFLNYRKDAIGVDGSDTKFAQKKFIDLCEYTSNVEGIHMRHVLEHNYNWQKILKNALNSATKKIAITFFIPPSDEINETIEVDHNKEYGINVPNLRICKKEFLGIINDKKVKNISSIKLYNDGLAYDKCEELFFIDI